jgi:hypothetical protein
MPRVSKTELQLRQAIDALSKIGLDENQPTYIRRPALSAIVRHGMDIRERKAEAAAAKAQRDKANQPIMSWLPERGEGEANYRARVARQKAQLASAD